MHFRVSEYEISISIYSQNLTYIRSEISNFSFFFFCEWEKWRQLIRKSRLKQVEKSDDSLLGACISSMATIKKTLIVFFLNKAQTTLLGPSKTEYFDIFFYHLLFNHSFSIPIYICIIVKLINLGQFYPVI